MKKFIVYLMVIVLTVSLGFAVYYLVDNNEVISISTASIYTDVDKEFSIDVKCDNRKSYTTISVSSSDNSIVSVHESSKQDTYTFKAESGGVARIVFTTSNSNFRNLYCDVIVGDGTAESPYYVGTAAQLAAIGAGEYDATAKHYKGGDNYPTYYSDCCYKLINNIDVQEYNRHLWTPLNKFSGILDGSGYTISNVNLNEKDYKDYVVNDLKETYDESTFSGGVGLFREIAPEAKVYNIKLEKFEASGEYDYFGTIAGKNYGSVMRIEVKDAFLDVRADTTAAKSYIGGIVGLNASSEDDKHVRHFARVDRCSINMIAGVNYDTADGSADYSKGMTGIIGGLVGYNYGGTVINSYSTGLVNFASAGATFGGIVGKSEFITYTTNTPADLGFSYSSLYGGANIKDCYTSLSTHMQSGDTNLYAGIVAEVIDHKASATNNKVVNQMMGLYYDIEKINTDQTGTTKEIKVGILKYTIDGSEKVLNDTKYVVMGKDSSAMKVQNTYVTASKQTIVYDEEGDFGKVENVDIPWLFGSVWNLDSQVNNGYPTLNYNLLDLGEDFDATVYATYDVHNAYSINSNGDFDIAFMGYAKEDVINLDKGDKTTLQVNPKNLEITWSSSNTAVATVSNTGEVTAVDYGAATITATTQHGKTATISVAVTKVNYVITAPKDIVVAYNGSDNLNAKVSPTKDGYTLWYTIDDIGIATIDDSGKISGRGVGDTTAHIYYGIKDTVGSNHEIYASAACNVKVTCDEYTITLSQTSLTLEKDSRHNLTATVSPNDTVTWSTLNTSVIALVPNGNTVQLHAVGVGTTIVTAVKGNTTAACTITVYETPDVTYSISVTPESITLIEGENYGLSYVITASDGSDTSGLHVSWSTSDASIAMATSNGLVTAGTQGTATITATLVNDTTITDTCTVNVVKATAPTPTVTTVTINLNKNAMLLYVGDQVTTDTITATATSSSGAVNVDFSFTSTNTNIATVNASGLVTPVAPGIAAIVVTVTTSGYTGSTTCYVQVEEKTTPVTPPGGGVTPPVQTGISLSKSSVSLFVNASTNVSVILTNATSYNVSVGDSSLITASKSGNTVTIKALTYTGSTTVTVTNEHGDTATCNVVVNTFSISLSKSSASVVVGASVTITATTNPSGYTVSWANQNTSIVTVSTNGNSITITGQSAGTATITATANGVTTKCTITVSAVTYSVSLSSSMSINHKESKKLTATITASNGAAVDKSKVTWSVSNTNVTINSYSGVTEVTVYGANVGSAVVTVKIGSYSKSCTVQVNSLWSKDIYTLDQLKQVSTKLDETYYLCADINVGSWTPIGTSSAPFTGKFIGKTNPSTNAPYILSNITVSGKTYAGLFGYTKGASIYNIKISGSSISGDYAGAVVGYMNGGSTYDIKVDGTSVTGSKYAGGVAGYSASGSIYSSAVTGSKEIKLSTTIAGSAVGGIVGYSTGTVGSSSSSSRVVSVSGSVVVNGSSSGQAINIGGIVGNNTGTIGYARFSASSVKVSGSAKGYVGGIAGNNTGSISNSYVKTTVSGNMSDSSSFTGGIVGRDAGSAKLTISKCGVTGSSISGYYAGGIVGSLSSSQSITMNWNSSNYKSGYNKSAHLTSSSYTVNVRETGVESSVTVTGVYAGGLAGIITNGVISDSYTQANLKGYNGSSVKAGFAPVIQSSGMYNLGGTGTAGIVIRCYTACKINSSNGEEHYVTASIVHKYATNNSMRSAGYVIDYVFDKDITSATAPGFSGWVVNYAAKSSSEMKTASTYTSVGFTSTYWNMPSGTYNTLKNLSYPF
ncbi:MAG: Ig-like domain-containing protein [Clostridia bacterium]|nr:Ig-like domain-containing protein [Clostridia bacterium]